MQQQPCYVGSLIAWQAGCVEYRANYLAVNACTDVRTFTVLWELSACAIICFCIELSLMFTRCKNSSLFSICSFLQDGTIMYDCQGWIHHHHRMQHGSRLLCFFAVDNMCTLYLHPIRRSPDCTEQLQGDESAARCTQPIPDVDPEYVPMAAKYILCTGMHVK